MTTTSMRTLNPIIRDRAGAVHPGLAAIASITGQPLTAVVQVPDRLYADERRRPRMGELLRTYARSPGPCERLFAICESGGAFAFLGA